MAVECCFGLNASSCCGERVGIQRMLTFVFFPLILSLSTDQHHIMHHCLQLPFVGATNTAMDVYSKEAEEAFFNLSYSTILVLKANQRSSS